jgi:CspA family cold shock protein
VPAPVLGALRRGVLFFSNGPATLVRFRFEKYEGDLQMQNGTIKKLVTDRGFGFIAADDGKEYFFHRSGTEADFDGLRGGELVTFEVEASPKGPRAGRVRIA